MTPADRTRFGQALGVLAVNLGHELTDAEVNAYWDTLRDLPISAVEAACFDLRASATFWPKPSEIIKLTQQSESRRADYAWGEVVHACRNVRTAAHPDPVVEAIVKDLGGWGHLGRDLSARDLGFKAKEFRRMYLAAKADEAARERLGGREQQQITEGGT